MNMMADIGGRRELLRQARICRALGSDFVANVLEAGYRQLFHAPHTAELIAGWPGDVAASAMAMRFNGALHALARSGRLRELAALYGGEHCNFDSAIGAALAIEDRFIAERMRDTTQTNEVGRAAAILGALMQVQSGFGYPCELLEMGASAGLNLNLMRYAYDLGGHRLGDTDSAVRIAPEWRGAAPSLAPVSVAVARGVDLHPLDAANAADRDCLLSYIWADRHERLRRTELALDIARRFPPRVERGNAVSWLAERLQEPQQAGQCRVVLHSMFLQYLSAADRDNVERAIRRAGEAATTDRPLAWISFEWTADRGEVQLNLCSWPDGERRMLAVCHPYGDWIDWRAGDGTGLAARPSSVGSAQCAGFAARV